MICDWEKETDRITEALRKGEELYNQLLELRPDGTDLIVCPEHLGDTLWMAVFAGAYIKTHECESIYYVVKESQNEIVNYFPDIDGTVVMSNDEMLSLRTYIITCNLWCQDHIVYGFFRETLTYKNDKFSFVQYSNGNNMIEARLQWLGLSNGHKPSKMLPLDEGDDSELKQLFEKSILFMPSAWSVHPIPMSFWKSLAKSYADAGFTIYTNYNGLDYERMIEGTKPLSSSIMELARIAPYFAQVISLRSGACDLLAETPANLSVLYSYELPNKGIALAPGDVTWDSIHELMTRKELNYFQYLPGYEQELNDALLKQVRI